MTDRVEFVGPEDPAWGAALAETRHDVYHLPEYARLSMLTDGGSPGAFVYRHVDATIVWPLLVRKLPPHLTSDAGLRDAIGVYGYGSPAATPGMSATVLARAFDRIGAAAADMRLVTAFSRLHPLLPLDLGRTQDRLRVVRSGVTAGVDLLVDRTELWGSLRKGHRSDIRRLQGRGYRVAWDDWSRLPDFVRMYGQTMERVEASDYYRFPVDYFTALRDDLAGRVLFGLVRAPDGSLVSGALFFRCEGIMQYHLSATTPEGLRLGAGKLLIWEAAQRGADAGAHVLHLGGGYGGAEDSLLRFKLGFATNRYTFDTLRFITDAESYAELCRRAGRGGGRLEGQSDGFFPPYRATTLPEVVP